MKITLAVLALALWASAASASDDVSPFLDQQQPARAQAIDAAGAGLHDVETSTRTPADHGLKEAAMGAKKMADEAPPPDPSRISWKPAPRAAARAGASEKSASGENNGSTANNNNNSNNTKSAQTSAGDWSLLPAELRNLKWAQPFPTRLGEAAAMFGRCGSTTHVRAPLQPGQGISVGFMPESGGHCSHVGTPSVPADIGHCTFNAWISETAGGPPASKDCATTGILTDYGASVSYAATPDGKSTGAAMRGICPVKAGTRYWCNVSGCPGSITSPLGIGGYTREEGIAIAEGKDCTVGTLIGHFRNGVCTDDQGNTTPPPDNRPACSNEGQKLPGDRCIDCAGGMMVSCDRVKIVENCFKACHN